MKLSNKFYDCIKYLCCIGIPACNVAILALGKVFPQFACAEIVSQCLLIAQTLLGSLFCISVATYSYNSKTQTIEPSEEQTDGNN